MILILTFVGDDIVTDFFQMILVDIDIDFLHFQYYWRRRRETIHKIVWLKNIDIGMIFPFFSGMLLILIFIFCASSIIYDLGSLLVS